MEQDEYYNQNEQVFDDINSIELDINKPRASKFRGVSKNGSQW